MPGAVVVEEIVRRANRNPHEVLSSLGGRVPRVFSPALEAGQVLQYRRPLNEATPAAFDRPTAERSATEQIQ